MGSIKNYSILTSKIFKEINKILYNTKNFYKMTNSHHKLILKPSTKVRQTANDKYSRKKYNEYLKECDKWQKVYLRLSLQYDLNLMRHKIKEQEKLKNNC